MNNYIYIFLYVVTILLFWKISHMIFDIPLFIFPTIESVFISMTKILNYVYGDILTTGLEIILGMLLGLFVGVTFAILFERYYLMLKIFHPIILMSQSIPVFAIAPLLVLWFGYGITSKIVMAAIIIFFPIVNAYYQGMQNIPRGYIDFAKICGYTKGEILFNIKLKYAISSLVVGIKTSAGLAPIAAIVGEWVGSSSGLGYKILYYNARLETSDMFSCLIILFFLTFLFYFYVNKLTLFLFKRYLND